MRGKLLTGLISLFFCVQINAQSLTLSLPDTTIGEGETVQLAMLAQDFDEISSVQFSINWDVTVIEYLSETEVDVDNIAIGATQAAQGILRLSWFPSTGQPQTFPDGITFVALNFRAVGTIGDTTTVALTDTPLAIQITQAGDQPNEFVEIDLVQDTGIVRIGTALGLSIDASDVRCFGDMNGQIAIDFTNLPAGGTVQWSGPNNFTSNAMELENLAPGIYQLTVRDVDNNVLLITNVEIAAPDNALAIDSILVTPTPCDVSDGTASIEVSGGIGPFTFEVVGESQNMEGFFQGLGGGNYDLLVSDANGCTIDSTFEIPGPPIPQVNLGETLSLCAGEQAILDAGPDFETYFWSTGESGQTITINTPGTYSVTVTNAFECNGSGSIEVTEGEALEVVIENDLLELCPGDSLELVVSGANVYEWIDTSQTLSVLDEPMTVARPLYPTTYTVIGSNSCKQDTAVLDVFVFESLATGGPDTCIIIGEELELDASGGVAYIWSINADFPVSDPTIPNPIVSPKDTTNYVVRIVDENACIIMDSVMVAVLENIQDVKAVNLITPNGDGKNDVLEFQGLGKFRENTLKVFNRWGDQVYSKVNYQNDGERFDGTYKGSPLPAGTYFYVLSLRSGEVKQALTIVRE